ncbi:hypothetical protein BMS3Bbin06_02106 [bacterium BMS3Bbin06]|nr:hypothetical protein BMS3Bbin06_02106 [bacterium BMS3Bbin06]HDO36432.1 prepilin-type N-terminal cleavage/methylation domain-containing protein [Nitrospirota bacterium]HDY71750.1 prepilin-type N-terminal cleavage/methylation domain-containing protein [Nitrospirota bacterium]
MKPIRHRAGFTLLEVLIALAITGGAVVTIIYTVNYQLSVLQRHETITEATLIAERILDGETGPVEKADGTFKPMKGGFKYRISKNDSGIPGVVLLEVTVRKGDEEVTMRRLIKR